MQCIMRFWNKHGRCINCIEFQTASLDLQKVAQQNAPLETVRITVDVATPDIDYVMQQCKAGRIHQEYAEHLIELMANK